MSEYTFGDTELARERLGIVAATFKAPTKALLADLPPSLDGPVLLVVTARPTAGDPGGRSGLAEDTAAWAHVELEALGPDAAAWVVAHAFGGPVDAHLGARLVDLGRGNPLFQVIEDAPLYRVIELLQITQCAAIKFNRPGQERVSLLPD